MCVACSVGNSAACLADTIVAVDSAVQHTCQGHTEWLETCLTITAWHMKVTHLVAHSSPPESRLDHHSSLHLSEQQASLPASPHGLLQNTQTLVPSTLHHSAGRVVHFSTLKVCDQVPFHQLAAIKKQHHPLSRGLQPCTPWQPSQVWIRSEMYAWCTK